MKITTKILILTFIISIFFGCGDMKYSITEKYISGISKNDGFTIAELIGDKSSEEKLRVCCETITGNRDLNKKLYFNRKNKGYQWSLCTLDLRFVENDSLKNLTLHKKLEIIKKENNGDSTVKYYETIPIDFKADTWYHFFGFEDIEGSFFVYVEKDKSFRLEYFGGGPL
jgi:hypothetical protein